MRDKSKYVQIEHENQLVLSTYEQRLADFKWELGLNWFGLNAMGIWPGDNEAEGLRRLFANLFVPFIMLLIIICVFLPQMYALVMVINELPLVIDNLLTLTSAFASCIKLFFIWRSKPVLRPVIHSITQDWLEPRTRWEREAMRREAARARFFNAIGYAFMIGCYIGFATAPVLGIKMRIITNITDYGDRSLLTQSYYPFDYSPSPTFEICYATQLVAAFFIGVSLSVPDNFFAVLVLHVCGQFEILGVNLENLFERREKEESGLPREFRGRMGAYVERHVHLIRLVGFIEDSFCFVVLAQIACMSIMVMCLGFQILNSLEEGSEHQASYIQITTLMSTLFTHSMHTLFDCFVAEELAFRSSGLFHEVYKSEWYAVEKEKSLGVIPIMVASKNPRSLMAGKILILSLSTYCSILKSVGGYISMLVAVHKQ